jgi:hypothetical protein
VTAHNNAIAERLRISETAHVLGSKLRTGISGGSP